MSRSSSLALSAAAVLVLLASSPAVAAPSCPFSTSGQPLTFKLNGDVNTPLNVDLALLQSLRTSHETVAFVGGSGLETVTYIGVALIDLLNVAGLAPVSSSDVPNAKNAALRTYVVVTGSDCYAAVVSLAEILPTFGGQQILVAFAQLDKNGHLQELTDPSVGEGMARLVVPGDKAGGRYVSNIVQIKVHNASWQ
ncbi:MAG TPA: hypothetical protein VMK12_25080 [Anaeromyxobacteraceae bacterium]|nr:hypothetical protein [Anaeromyxobacteraceae bacterium]